MNSIDTRFSRNVFEKQPVKKLVAIITLKSMKTNQPHQLILR